MLKRILPAICIIASITLPASGEVISLTAALANKSLSFKATGNGHSYHEKALNLDLANNTAKTVTVRIDTASIFRPDDTAYQDIMLAGGDVVNIAPHKTVTVQAQSYCAKSYGHAPGEGLNFSYWKQGDEKMVKLMAFAMRERLGSSLVQDAVWVLTNDHLLGAIYDSHDPRGSEKLVKFMVGLVDQQMPEVFEEHKKVTTPGAPVYVPKALKMYAKFEWTTDKAKTMTLGVYNSEGKMMEPVFENKEIEKGGHRITVEFESADVPAGKYYIRLLEGNIVLKEQEVEVR